MASLKDIAREYRRSAKLLTDRVNELSGIDTSMMSYMRRFRLKAKINKLESWALEMLSTATMLEHYYDRSGGQLMDNLCLMCGEIIPEGRMVCPLCEKRIMDEPNDKEVKNDGQEQIHRARH